MYRVPYMGDLKEPKEMFQQIPYQVDLKRLREDVKHIQENFPGYDGRQWSLLFADGEQHDTGVLNETRKLIEMGKRYRESNYCHFHRDLKHLYIHDFYYDLQLFLGRPLGRMRIFNLSPGTCYSYHTDSETRYHVAVHTNDKCFFILQNQGRNENGIAQVTPTVPDMRPHVGVFHIPQDSHVYALDLNRRHTAINSGDALRTHICINGISHINDRVER